MALDNFRRITIDVDTANDYIPPVMLSGGDSNGRTLLVKLTDNGKAVTSAAGITAKLAYADGCGNSGYKTMTSVSGYETAAWECAAPGSVLKTDSAHLCVQFWQGSDVVCTRIFHASVDRNLVSLESGITSGDAVKELYDTIANLNKVIDRANASASKADSSAASANANADAANKAASAATAAAKQANAAAAATKPYYMQASEPARDKRVDGMLWMKTNESTKKIAAFNRWDANLPGTALWPGATTFPSDTTFPDEKGAWTAFGI